jgi:hypothetical protein
MLAMDMEPSRCLAYTFVEPACADPGLFIRLALEQRGGNPPIRLAPSSYDTMMVVFAHLHFREMVVRRGPIDMGGHRLFLIRHEEADFRINCSYSRLVELTATNFPLEHWNETDIHVAFHAFGQVCKVTRSYLREVDDHVGYGVADYSVVRVLVILNANRRVTSKLLVCNPDYVVSAIANIRLVDQWPYIPSAPLPDDHDFSEDHDDDVSDGGPPSPPSSRVGQF